MGATWTDYAAIVAAIAADAAARKAAASATPAAVESAAPLPAAKAGNDDHGYRRGSTTAPLGGYIKGVPTPENLIVRQIRELRSRIENLSPSEAAAGEVLRARCAELENELVARRY